MGEVGVSHGGCVGLRCLGDGHVMKTVFQAGTVVEISLWVFNDDVALLITWDDGTVRVCDVWVDVSVGPFITG